MPARLVSTVLVLFFALARCGGDEKKYIPPDSGQPDVPESPDASGGPETADVPFPDLGELPDAAGISLDPASATALKILSPSSATAFSVSSGSLSGTPLPTVSVGGVGYGPVSKLYVESQSGDRLDLPTPDTDASPYWFFAAPPVELFPPLDLGEVWEARTTRLSVVAELDGNVVAWDSVLVTATPGFQFPTPLVRNVDAVFADESTDVLFTLDLNQVAGFDPAQVVLMESDSTCSTKVGLTAKIMSDDGDIVVSGDQLASDQVYTKVYRLQKPTAGVRHFRAAITVDLGAEGKLVTYTPCVPLFVVPRITQVACSAAQSVLQQARQLYDAQLNARIPGDEARKVVVAWLRSLNSVDQAGARAGSPLVWVHFTSGFFGAVTPTIWEEESATLLYPPISDAPAQKSIPSSRLVASAGHDLAPLSDFLDELDCPPWRNISANSQTDSLRQLPKTGLAFFAGPGGVAFDSMDYSALDAVEPGFSQAPIEVVTWLPPFLRAPQPLVFTQSPASCDAFMDRPDSCMILPDGSCCTDCLSDPVQPCNAQHKCVVTQAAANSTPVGTLYDSNQIDLAMGRLVLGLEHWAISPAFIAAHGGSSGGPDMAYLGFSNSLAAPGMLLAFLATGTKGVVGVDESVSPENALSSGVALLKNAMGDAKPVATMIPQHGSDNADLPWRLIGSGTVDLAFADIINPNFSSGDLKGWQATGDARVLASWCGQSPAQQYMAFISTGVGFTPQTGSLKQEFCLPPGKLVFRSAFQFISHELLESCGVDQYQDQYRIELETETGEAISLLAPGVDMVNVNMICPCDAGNCGTCLECGSQSCECGFWFQPSGQPALQQWPEACYFDNGDAWGTGWRTPSGVNVSALAGLGKPVTINVSVSDRGDSAGDTSVLVDSLEFE